MRNARKTAVARVPAARASRDPEQSTPGDIPRHPTRLDASRPAAVRPSASRPSARVRGLAAVVLTVATALTVAAALQQALLAAGFGGWLPDWQPLPLLLLAAPLWVVLWRRGTLRDAPRALLRTAGTLRRVPGWAYTLAVLALTCGVWAWLQQFEPYMAHEESVYANKARFWQDGTPDAGWGLYRPPGLPALGRLALALHPDVGALRAVALLLALSTLLTVYAVAAHWLSPRRAVVVLLLLLSGLGLLRRLPEFLTDIGATGLLLLTVFLLVRAQERPGSRALLLLPLPVLAAFHLRYGVVGTLLAITLAALIAYGPRAWLPHGRRLAAAGGLILAGLVPHLLYAVHTTGSPLGIILYATDQANRQFFGDGLLYYLAVFPYRLAGALGAVVMTAGLVLATTALRRTARARRGAARDRSRDPAGHGHGPEDADAPAEQRRWAFLGLSAVLTCVTLGLATDGEPRFIYLPVVLLTLLGVRYLTALPRGWGRVAAAACCALAALSVPATAQVVAHQAMPGPHRLSESTVPVARALAAERERTGQPCLAVTGYVPETGWYSGCDALTYADYRQRYPSGPPSDRTVHFVRYENGRLQPGEQALHRLLDGRSAHRRTLPATGTAGGATVLTLPRPAPGP